MKEAGGSADAGEDDESAPLPPGLYREREREGEKEREREREIVCVRERDGDSVCVRACARACGERDAMRAPQPPGLHPSNRFGI
jgi:hypothetical protein